MEFNKEKYVAKVNELTHEQIKSVIEEHVDLCIADDCDEDDYEALRLVLNGEMTFDTWVRSTYCEDGKEPMIFTWIEMIKSVLGDVEKELFCKIVETETTQILIKKDYDSEEDVLFVSIETSYENAMVTISPKLKVGATKGDQQNMFDKFVARAEEMGDNLVPAFLDMYK